MACEREGGERSLLRIPEAAIDGCGRDAVDDGGGGGGGVCSSERGASEARGRVAGWAGLAGLGLEGRGRRSALVADCLTGLTGASYSSTDLADWGDGRPCERAGGANY